MTLLNSVAFSYPLLIIITFGKMKKIFFFSLGECFSFKDSEFGDL